MGVSVETDKYVFRVDHLREVDAAVRFVSAEPLLGSLPSMDLSDIDWVIAGGESGKAARPMHPTWARQLRDSCRDAGVAFFFKQWGTWAPAPPEAKLSVTVAGNLVQSDKLVGVPGAPAPVQRSSKAAAGRLLDGRTWDEMPARAGHLR
jgi:protein gp37